MDTKNEIRRIIIEEANRFAVAISYEAIDAIVDRLVNTLYVDTEGEIQIMQETN